LTQEVVRMHLTQYSTFALRTLQYVALHDPAIVTVDEVSRAHRISKSHLVKVSYELGQRGYIQTVRGRNGGMRLARPAEQITVGEIVRWAEAPLELVECFNPETNTCPLEGACHLSRGIQRALRAFLSVLDDLTIADITVNRGILLDRLASQPSGVQ
jgi:Rrf2 family transcriptional regulator, nitric oxide-sensitive transcriptional repressor